MMDRLALVLATWFGAGFSPRAPGTAGTIATLPLFWALTYAPPFALPLATLLVTAVGVWAAQRVAVARGEEDPQIIVIDESAGVLVALWIGAAVSLWSILLATVLFRLFDIWKPGPIRWLETLKPPGVGIMADDLAAGLVAGVIVRLAGAYLA
jgi:phosphatidylglycerophosphatase A